MERILTRAEFSRLAGVTKQAVGKACRAQLAPACVGKRIDGTHPAAQAYLEQHGQELPEELDRVEARAARARPAKAKAAQPAAGAPPSPPRAPPSPPSAPPSPGPAPPGKEPVRVVAREVSDVSAVADMTIRQVVEKFGTVTAFKDWLQALRTIEDVREKNLRNAETDGNLISVHLVKTHVMGAIEQAFRRLLTDAAKTIARRLYSAAKSGVPIEDAEQLVRDIISSQLKPIKDASARTLRAS